MTLAVVLQILGFAEIWGCHSDGDVRVGLLYIPFFWDRTASPLLHLERYITADTFLLTVATWRLPFENTRRSGSCQSELKSE